MSIRKELEAVLRSGKSVFYGGTHYKTVSELPSEATLAKGDAQQEEAARASIKAELRRLAGELASLEDGKEADEAVERKLSPKPQAEASEEEEKEAPKQSAKSAESKKEEEKEAPKQSAKQAEAKKEEAK